MSIRPDRKLKKAGQSWDAALREAEKVITPRARADQLLIEAESTPGREVGDRVKVTYDRGKGTYTVRTGE